MIYRRSINIMYLRWFGSTMGVRIAIDLGSMSFEVFFFSFLRIFSSRCDSVDWVGHLISLWRADHYDTIFPIVLNGFTIFSQITSFLDVATFYKILYKSMNYLFFLSTIVLSIFPLLLISNDITQFKSSLSI
jgi:hypothetical protein